MSGQEQGDIKTVYEEICRSHDGIVDFRYKLLAFLPIASGAGVFPPDIIHWWAENDRQFRQELENIEEVDGADIALLLMETQKRYTA